MKLMLDQRGGLSVGQRVLHLAPERGLGLWLREQVGDGYDPRDLDPLRYRRVRARKIDLIKDAECLPTAEYDLIVHSHVMEHVPCNITAVLWHLHRALKPTGLHLCCIPFMNAHYGEDLGPLSDEERRGRYGQSNHVRRFGARDLPRHLGMVFRLPEAYDITARFGAGTLNAHAVPEAAWRGWTPHSVLELPKDALKLR